MLHSASGICIEEANLHHQPRFDANIEAAVPSDLVPPPGQVIRVLEPGPSQGVRRSPSESERSGSLKQSYGPIVPHGTIVSLPQPVRSMKEVSMGSEQRVAVITGASGGIGAALVKAYRDRNYRVVATARSMEPLSGDDVMVVSGDIADRKTAERAISEGMARFGRIDTLVNNAGIFIAKPFTEPGDNPQPVCLVGLELRSDRKVR